MKHDGMHDKREKIQTKINGINKCEQKVLNIAWELNALQKDLCTVHTLYVVLYTFYNTAQTTIYAMLSCFSLFLPFFISYSPFGIHCFYFRDIELCMMMLMHVSHNNILLEQNCGCFVLSFIFCNCVFIVFEFIFTFNLYTCHL